MPPIEPNSPEAQKLARKIRSTFFFIAALNFVVIAIIAFNVWPQFSGAAELPAKEPVKPADSKPADAKPADAKASETKPADSKPAEAKPGNKAADPEKKEEERPREGRRGGGRRPPPKPVVVAKTPEEKAAIAAMEALNEKVLAAYNSQDQFKFAQDFSAYSVPKPDANYFKNVITDLYFETFGEITSKKFLAETKADANYGMLVYECAAKKRKARLSVNFRREATALKIVQWRMEKM